MGNACMLYATISKLYCFLEKAGHPFQRVAVGATEAFPVLQVKHVVTNSTRIIIYT